MNCYDKSYYRAKAEALESMVTTFFRNAKVQINGSTHAHSRPDGSFFFIPFGIPSSFGMLHSFLSEELEGDPVEYFLDAGSGLGNIVTMAYHLGLARVCHGIEYDENYVDFANRFMVHDNSYPTASKIRNSKIEYIRGDILTFEDYSKYDVIYYFCPFSSHTLELAFEEMVEDQMKVGAYLIGCNKQGWNIRRDSRFEELRGIKGNVWKKVSDGPREVRLASEETRASLSTRWAKRYPHFAR